jgi:outer membrane lipase/esterase
MSKRTIAILTFIAALSQGAGAQDFNQAIVFGDSTVDSGWYRNPANPPFTPPVNANQAKFNNDVLVAATQGGGKPTTGPGLMNSEVLAAYFGLTALPANQPGGTNYATSGARSALDNEPGDGLFTGDTPTTAQFNNYLAGNGGRANRDALYLINSGNNDIAFALDQTRTTADFPLFPPQSAQAFAYLAAQANALVAGIVQLNAAGARYIIVPNYGESLGGATIQAYRAFMGDTVWSGLAAAGINFIPADFNAVRLAIANDPASFGFQFATPANPACTTSHSLLCTPATLVAPNADQTHLFADEDHFTTAGQKIFGDYYYSLVVAPSQISFLPETAVKTRMRLVSNIQTQIEATRQQAPGPSGLNLWITGDVSHLEMENYRGFPDDPSTPTALAAGISRRFPGGVIVGAAISAGRLESDFSKGRGDFEQEELSGSVYAGLLGGPLWGTLIGTYGRLDYDVNRLVPLGITVQSNSGQTDGRNVSLAAQAGYNFTSAALTHGPVVGLTWQRVEVDGFTETGSVTSLAFGDQTRDSAISALGYRASLDLGGFRPFAQLVWHHELASTGREVTAILTTTTAPGYHMPAVVLGKDWGTATIGANVKLGAGVSALAAFSTDFGQDDAVTYGAQVGLNVAF